MTGGEEGLVKPAVNGTMAAMKACQAAGVKRCVVTSSCASIAFCAEANRPEIFNESHWSDVDRPEGLHPYLKSKTLAEKVAWDFQKALPAAEKFEIVTICPGLVMGPPLKKESSQSIDFTKFLMEGKKEKIGSDHMMFVDIRNVAEAHFLAVKKPEAANKRYILCESTPTYLDYAAPLEAKYRPLGYPITEDKQPLQGEWYPKMDNSASKQLGIKYIGLEKSMLDMAEAMIAKGMIVKPTQ